MQLQLGEIFALEAPVMVVSLNACFTPEWALFSVTQWTGETSEDHESEAWTTTKLSQC